MYLFGLDFFVLVLSILTSAIVALIVSGFAKEILCFLLENSIEKLKGERNTVLLTIKKNMVEKLKQLVMSVTTMQKASIMTLFYSSIASVLSLCIKYSDFIFAHWIEAMVILAVCSFSGHFALKSLKTKKQTKKKKDADSLAKEIVAELESNARFNSMQISKTAKPAVVQTNLQRKSQVIPAQFSPEDSQNNPVSFYDSPFESTGNFTDEQLRNWTNETYH